MADSCAGCRFFDPSWETYGVCRRNAPTVTDFTDGERFSVWPPVDHDDWCGEFEQRLCGVAGCVLADGHTDRWHRLIDGKLMQVVEMEEVDG